MRAPAMFCEDLVFPEDLVGLRHSTFIHVLLHVLLVSITIFSLLMKQASQLQ